MSDGGRGRALLGVEVWKPSWDVDTERSDVRSIAWLDGLLAMHDAQDLTVAALDIGFCNATSDTARK
jgi:hypothetical protein